MAMLLDKIIMYLVLQSLISSNCISKSDSIQIKSDSVYLAPEHMQIILTATDTEFS